MKKMWKSTLQDEDEKVYCSEDDDQSGMLHPTSSFFLEHEELNWSMTWRLPAILTIFRSIVKM